MADATTLPGGPSDDPAGSDLDFDEFAAVAEMASEAGLEAPARGSFARTSCQIPSGRHISALRWGDAEPATVFFHGGGQNAHTWDAVVLRRERPALAFDLPGHGHSDWRPDGVYDPAILAGEMAEALLRMVSGPVDVVGMSLGGLTAIGLAAQRPDLVRRVVVVDVSPGVTMQKSQSDASQNGELIFGQASYASFDEMLERVQGFRPGRSASSLRRGLRYNARRRQDGRWVWRHHYGSSQKPALLDFTHLWPSVERLPEHTMLVRGDRSKIVADEDVAEFRRRCPQVRYEVVADAGHSIQGDQAFALADLLDDFGVA